MEGRKRLPQGPRFTELSHIREPELDMRRHGRVQPGLFVRAYDMVRRLIANGGCLSDALNRA